MTDMTLKPKYTVEDLEKANNLVDEAWDKLEKPVPSMERCP
jgi:hypothetical protein